MNKLNRISPRLVNEALLLDRLEDILEYELGLQAAEVHRQALLIIFGSISLYFFFLLPQLFCPSSLLLPDLLLLCLLLSFLLFF